MLQIIKPGLKFNFFVFSRFAAIPNDVIMVCRICASSEFSIKLSTKEMMFGSGAAYAYTKCANCSTLQIDTVINDVKLLYPGDYYSFNYQSRLSYLDKLKKYIFAKIVQHDLSSRNLIGAFFGRSRPCLEARGVKGIVSKDDYILDVGCGNGTFVEALAALGFEHVEGLDPFIEKDIYGKNFTIHKKFLHELDKPGMFDVIMLHHSFEHMDNPLETLNSIYILLKPKGKCIIRIPVCDSFAFEKYRENWVQLDAPRHVFLHSNSSIAFLADKTHFTIVNTINDSTAFQFIGSEQYVKGISLNAHFSYYQPLYKKWIGRAPHTFTKAELKNFKSMTADLNKKGKGDQRIYILERK